MRNMSRTIPRNDLHKTVNPIAVCAIVLNWNGAKDTLECLNSLSSIQYPLTTIVLVDNASSDNSREEIVKWAQSVYPADAIFLSDPIAGHPTTDGPAFVFLQNPTNAGYAGGNNAGIRYAMSIRAYDFIWILNNDTVVAPDALSHLIHNLQCHPEAGIAGSTVVYHASPEKVQCAGGCRYNPWTTIYSPIMANQPLEYVLRISNAPEMDYMYGAAMFVRSSVFERCGFFNENYFLFYEEIDFCKKAVNNGYRLLWTPRSIVYHKFSQSVGKPDSASNVRMAFANYHENLSALLYARTLNPFIFIFSLLFRFLGKFAVITRKRQFFLVKPLMAAYMDFFMDRNQKGDYHYKQ